MVQKYVIWIVSGAIAIFLVVYGLILSSVFSDLPDRGAFGDMFGGATALFSGLAFAGMVYAILLQSRELALQRDEFKAMREEQSRAADAQQSLVEKQLLNSRIAGMSAIVQGRYAYINSHGANSVRHLSVVKEPERLLVKYLKEAGSGAIPLEDIRRS